MDGSSRIDILAVIRCTGGTESKLGAPHPHPHPRPRPRPHHHPAHQQGSQLDPTPPPPSRGKKSSSSSSGSSSGSDSGTYPGESAVGEATAAISGCSLVGSISSYCGMYSGYIGSRTKSSGGGDCGSSGPGM
ncbi:hypothetical protein Tco_0088580 [Tanacetum coccineum]